MDIYSFSSEEPQGDLEPEQEALDAIAQMVAGDMAWTDVLALGTRFLDTSPASSFYIASHMLNHILDDEGVIDRARPEYAQSMELMGLCQQKMDRHETAVDVFYTLCEVCPGIPRYQILYARALLEVSDEDSADAMIQKVAKLNPDAAVTLDIAYYYERKAAICREEKDYADADAAKHVAISYVRAVLDREDCAEAIRQAATQLLLRLRDDNGPGHDEIALAM